MKKIQKLKFFERDLKVLLIFLSGDLFYFFLYLAHKAARLLDIGVAIRNPAFELTRDLGVPESYQYVKEFWIVILFAWFIYKSKNYSFFSWMFLYFYLLFDDMLRIHEELSTFIFARFGIVAEDILFTGFRYQDIGELAISLAFGIFFLLLIIFAYKRENLDNRNIYKTLTTLLFALLFFGIGIDMADQLISNTGSKLLIILVDILEDGGEMLVMSLTCWYVYTLTSAISLKFNTAEQEN